jgi:hypothetical protein
MGNPQRILELARGLWRADPVLVLEEAKRRWPEYAALISRALAPDDDMFAEPTAATLAPGVEQPRMIPDRITVDRGRVQELLDSGLSSAAAQRKAVEEARATTQEGY